jgi:uncharacterized membrane protein YdbT with pleckstrin-like domain
LKEKYEDRAREKEKEKEKKDSEEEEEEEEEEEKEENSLDNPKHTIRTMLSNRTIIESRSSGIFIVNSRESSSSVYYLSVHVPQSDMIEAIRGNTYISQNQSYLLRWIYYIH